jgi:prepilin-type processing-associated H-X9-DG protein
MQATSRSLHPGGVQVLMMDGSARFIADSVDPNVWHATHSRESHEVKLSFDADSVEDSSQKSAQEVSSVAQTTAAQTGGAHLTNSIGMKMARIPAGEFVMGLPDVGEEGATPLDVPPHRVRITKDFYMGIYEVTQGQYERIVGANPSWHTPNGGGKLEVLDQDHRQFPVEQVSWTDAVTFCHRLSALPAERAARRRYRLPTEAEWEYACRVGSTSPFQYPASSNPDKKSGFNMRPNRTDGLPITKVGSYPPNAFGLYDVRGNVMEWCADWFAWDYYKQSPVDDPQGPTSGVLRVVRGADWRFSGMACKYTRFDAEPWRSNPLIGFRVVCEQGSE